LQLFSKLKIRDLVLKNRVFVSPMCQYSSMDGLATNWHLVHLGARAIGGAGLVMSEAAAVSPEGRITANDLGIWNEVQALSLKPVTQFISEQGSIPAIQLAHAGRKACSKVPWQQSKNANEDWQVIGPSSIAFSTDYPTPKEMTDLDVQKVINDFARATELSLLAGFKVVEIHMAHGYLMHEFLSPLSNKRTDQYGGTLENRMRFPLQVARAVRSAWPVEWPVFVRISATDWTQGGWDLEQSIKFAAELRSLGIDLIDCSSGGNVPHAEIPIGPGYQVQFASEIKKRVGILTGAVGLITEASQAQKILDQDEADAIFLGRESLRDPNWPLRAASALGQPLCWPEQYERAKQ